MESRVPITPTKVKNAPKDAQNTSPVMIEEISRAKLTDPQNKKSKFIFFMFIFFSFKTTDLLP